MSAVESAISWMERTALDDSHGYSQINRWGPDYDCSSSVITAYQQAGVPLKTKGASWTGNLREVALKCGFKDVSNQVNLATGTGIKRGDILLCHNASHKHTAMACGNGKEVEASIDENGRTVGRLRGDQTGKEFLIRTYRRNYWQYCLRYQESPATASIPLGQTEVAIATSKEVVSHNGVPYRVMVSPLMMRTDADEDNAKIIGAFYAGNVVYYYGYYKLDKYGRKWLYVTDFKRTGYMCTKARNGKEYLTVKE